MGPRCSQFMTVKQQSLQLLTEQFLHANFSPFIVPAKLGIAQGPKESPFLWTKHVLFLPHVTSGAGWVSFLSLNSRRTFKGPCSSKKSYADVLICWVHAGSPSVHVPACWKRKHRRKRQFPLKEEIYRSCINVSTNNLAVYAYLVTNKGHNCVVIWLKTLVCLQNQYLHTQ